MEPNFRHDRRPRRGRWRRGDSYTEKQTRPGPRSRGRGKSRGYRKINEAFPGRNINFEELYQKFPNRTQLPIYAEKESILSFIANDPITIIQGETGCGKSTQIPQYIFERWPEKARIAVAQPRRLAVTNVAQRVADEMDVRLGSLVGYHIKGINKTSPETRIKFMTNGVLIQELSSDNFHWNFVILDEVHERSLEMDFLLLILKHRLSKDKNSLKLILMSATLQEMMGNFYSSSELERFSRLNLDEPSFQEENKQEKDPWDDLSQEDEELASVWANAWNDSAPKFETYKPGISNASNPFEIPFDDSVPTQKAGGSLFDVEIYYLKEVFEIVNSSPELYIADDFIQDYFQLDASYQPEEVCPYLYEVASRLILAQHQGDFKPERKLGTFLVFLPGIQEINMMCDKLNEVSQETAESFDICLLHTSIPEEEHMKVLREPPANKRRIILSTNIAESSVTITDVRFIVDFGYSREVLFNSNTQSESLELKWSSKAEMKQRAGRAGRVAGGVVFRLMPEAFFEYKLYSFSQPEIQRCPLDKVVLKLKQMNLGHPETVLSNAMQPPDSHEVAKTNRYLKEMGAINSSGEITNLGKLYANMPCDLKITRLCLFGKVFGCMNEALVIAGLLSLERSPFLSFANYAKEKSKEHPKIYISKLKYDNGMNSDVLTYLVAFIDWYKKFGCEVEKEMFRNEQRKNKNPKAIKGEMAYCIKNCINRSSMIEALSNYVDLKRRFTNEGFSKDHFETKNGKRKPLPETPLDNQTVSLLKMCIAGAFSRHLMYSGYFHSDESNRETLKMKIGKDKNKSIIVPNIPDFVTSEDITGLLHFAQEHVQIDIKGSTGFINFEQKNSGFNDSEIKFNLKLTLWLGSYPQRYNNLAWCVVKRTKRNPETDEIVEQETLGEHNWMTLKKVSRNLIREGKFARIDERSTKDNFKKSEEIAFLARPQYPYLLKFSDVYSCYEISIDSESVNHILFSENQEKAEGLLMVSSDYIQKKYSTLGKNTTMMPIHPLLPEIMTILYGIDVEFFADETNSRYDSFRVNSGTRKIKFNYEFTGHDLESINLLRQKMSSVLNEESCNDLEAPKEIVPVLFELLNRPRRRIRREYIDWRAVLDFPSSEKKLMVESPEEVDRYLRPLQPLQIPEDPRHWDPSAKELFAKEEQEIKQLKTNYCNELNKLAKRANFLEPLIVCRYCKNKVCSYGSIESTDESEVFIVRGTYGTLEHIQESTEELAESIAMRWEVSEFAVCREGHLIGWVNGQNTYVFSESPLLVELMNERYLPFSRELWNNNFSELHHTAQTEIQKRRALEYKVPCKVCGVKNFGSDKDFFHHIEFELEHRKNVQSFMESYIT